MQMFFHSAPHCTRLDSTAVRCRMEEHLHHSCVILPSYRSLLYDLAISFLFMQRKWKISQNKNGIGTEIPDLQKVCMRGFMFKLIFSFKMEDIKCLLPHPILNIFMQAKLTIKWARNLKLFSHCCSKIRRFFWSDIILWSKVNIWFNLVSERSRYNWLNWRICYLMYQ